MSYQDKIITMDEALDMVKSDFQVVTGLGAAEGKLFMEHIHERSHQLRNVTITNCLSMASGEFLKEEYVKSFNIDGWFFSPPLRRAFPHGNVSFIPNHLHLAGTRRLDHIKPDIYVGSASMPDKHGFISLSTSNTYERKMIEAADISILEINPNYPRTFGDLEIHYSEIDYLVLADYDVPTLPDVEPNEKDLKIGSYIAELINDGDTLQLGIGGIPNAVAAALHGKKDLGIHTEMMTSGMVDLIESGAITGKKKSLHRNKHVATFALGNKKLYDYIDNNPSIMLLNGEYVNDPAIIGLNDNMVSINTALEVDLTGQVASESIGHIQFSGTGGQADTAVGAQKAKNGRSFIALYSTAMVKDRETGIREEKSKIVPFLKQGAIVTLSRNDVDMIVTEYGVAHLRGTNVKERILRLIAICHPDFREDILKEAHELGLIYDK